MVPGPLIVTLRAPLGPKEEPAGPAVHLIIAAGGAEGFDCRRVK